MDLSSWYARVCGVVFVGGSRVLVLTESGIDDCLIVDAFAYDWLPFWKRKNLLVFATSLVVELYRLVD